MEIRRVRRAEAAGLRDLRLRALRDAPRACFGSLGAGTGRRPARACGRREQPRVGIFMARRL